MTDPIFLITYGNGDDAYVRLDKQNLVSDICDGQIEDINEVLECSPREYGSDPEETSYCIVVTEEIAEDVRAQLASELRNPSYELASWLQKVLGLDAAIAAE